MNTHFDTNTDVPAQVPDESQRQKVKTAINVLEQNAAEINDSDLILKDTEQEILECAALILEKEVL